MINEGEEILNKPIQRSFVFEPVFQTNDAAKRDEQDYCPN